MIATSAGPSHVGLIPDGMRRWARREGKALHESYALGITKLGCVCRELLSEDVTSISIYALSIDNLNRSAEELAVIFEIWGANLVEMLQALKSEHDLDLSVVGRLERLPPRLAGTLKNVAELKGRRRRIYILAAYDPWMEIWNATRHAANPAGILRELAVPDKVELVVRTGGTAMLSGFLPLQCTYAVLSSLPIFWNDITPEDVRQSVALYREIQHPRGS